MIRALIVDDERIAREGLRALLADEPDVDVVGECRSGREAIEAIRFHEPDVVLLDVQMPGMDGFELLEALTPDECPLCVFVTAYDEYALRAFEVSAVDYLLKPFDRDRFRHTWARVCERLDSARSGELRARMEGLLTRLERQGTVEASTPAGGRLALNDGRRVVLFEPTAIEFMRSRRNYVEIQAGERREVVRSTLTELERQLGGSFVRISRSCLVNLDRVAEAERLPGGRYQLRLDTGRTLESSRRYRVSLEDRL